MLTLGVIGLGSMGKRRVRDLRRLGHKVVGFDIRPDRNAEAASLFGIDVVDSRDAVFAAGLDAAIVAVPPDAHFGIYKDCYERRVNFFSEASIFTPHPRWFADQELKSRVQGRPSATWQFHPLVQQLRSALLDSLANVNTVHYHYGGYLPFWHPWEHYSDFYAGQKATSAAREMVPFEMEWLVWIFGRVRTVTAVVGRRADWVTDIDDSYILLLEFESGLLATLVVELHQVAPFRLARISCREHSFTLDLGAHHLRGYELATDTWREYKPSSLRSLGSFDFEDVYRAEIQAFCEAIEHQRPYPKSWDDERHLSNILFAAEQSQQRQRAVTIDEVDDQYDGSSCP